MKSRLFDHAGRWRAVPEWRRRGQIRAWLAVPLVLIAALTGPVGANPEAIRDFGTTTGEPIDSGFIIVGGVYTDAPYVVSRRGLDTYVNDVRVRQGADWPQPNLTVTADPGPPPKGVKPWDSPPSGKIEDNYWAQKWLYLKAKTTHKEAVALMKAAFEASDAFVKVEWGENQDIIVVHEAGGSKTPISYSQMGERTLAQMSKDELLAMHEGYREHYEKTLRAGALLMNKDGAELYVTGKRARDALAVLLGPEGADQKILALEKLFVLRTGDPTFHSDVRQFRASKQLAERLAKANREAEDAERHSQLISSVHGLAQGVDPRKQMADPAFMHPASRDVATVQPKTRPARPPALPASPDAESPAASSRMIWYVGGAILLLAVGIFVFRRILHAHSHAR